MEVDFSVSAGARAWQIVPLNGAAGAVPVALALWFVVRHAVLAVMVMDVLPGWLRRFSWFPGPGRRLCALVHWAVSLGLLVGFVAGAVTLEWLTLVPR